MRTLLTLDYEIFFGPQTGDVGRTLLAPTEALLELARRHGARLVFFVDAGFILALQREMRASSALRADHAALCRQVEAIARAGHEVQLHIHPHWEDARWSGGRWRLEGTRFALHAFDPPAIADIVRRYAAVLKDLAGDRAAYAYRAGGWVLQPFGKLREPLLAAGVHIDSTVYAGGHSGGEIQPFDFRGAPRKSRWRFDADPLIEDPGGRFLELPIASRTLSPLFFWRFAAAKKLGGARHRPFGDGQAIAMPRADLLRKLLLPSASVVSMDGYKASFLAAAARDYRRRGMEDFVVIGHPKALTPYSLSRLDAFLARHAGEVVTFAAYAHEKNARNVNEQALPSPGRRRAA